ncbi:type II toxin-antitoxin system ParD family antitoxin [Endozoicomonas gorgoniicola]|uniref:Antitoxin ParD n=1 Tax=Endozoicomonas gorgoniicola TaxID=1234144 RepID=A0ABT3MQH8_9GAMM|nr:type II toxin-antitoxin system ParD family antitoxin [Endozoicomonas gorgoniicola]MCW7551629.1 type II toxin-antitoxin system ParD family antitoxin [Endozoicomonas gorgoniicola]
MAKNTSITLGEHFDWFISSQVDSGRYGSASEVIRAALRLLESKETKLNTLRNLLIEGEDSGFAEYDYDTLIDELDSEDRK